MTLDINWSKLQNEIESIESQLDTETERIMLAPMQLQRMERSASLDSDDEDWEARMRELYPENDSFQDDEYSMDDDEPTRPTRPLREERLESYIPERRENGIHTVGRDLIQQMNDRAKFESREAEHKRQKSENAVNDSIQQKIRLTRVIE